jgi:energy-coupling factor transporter ATP-binding protein EcfA2
MRIIDVSIKNYRGFDSFHWTIGHDVNYIVSCNAGGKTNLLTALALALGQARSVSRADFTDPTQPLEIVLTLALTDPVEEVARFADFVDFGAERKLVIGAQATWDEPADEVEFTVGFPRYQWRRTSRRDLSALPVLWVPADRDPLHLLSFGLKRGPLRRALSGVDLGQDLATARLQIVDALSNLGNAPGIATVLRKAAQFLQDVEQEATQRNVTGTPSVQTNEDVMKQLELSVEWMQVSLPITRQSSGVDQLLIFAVLLATAKDGAVLLIDEPETSLHPHAQRALATMLARAGSQVFVATHSPAMLDSVDPRHVVQLSRTAAGVETRTASTLTPDQALDLARYSRGLGAEAFFANKVVFVEGLSDERAVEALARRIGRNLDAEGTTVLSLDGAGTLVPYLALFGPHGFAMDLAGLCDVDHEEPWRRALTNAGLGTATRAEMAARRFFVCDPDLETCLVGALGDRKVEEIVDHYGRSDELTRFVQQPTQVAKSHSAVLAAFLHKGNVFWVPRLVDELELAERAPTALFELIDAI